MLRNVLLGVGLVLELAGVILTLIIMTAIGALLSGSWPPSGFGGFPLLGQMSPDEFFGWFLFPTAFLLVLGFMLLSFGILYPKRVAEPLSEREENKV